MDEDEKECFMCKAFAGFGILLGIVFVAISVDLLTNGAISRLFSGKSEEMVDDNGE